MSTMGSFMGSNMNIWYPFHGILHNASTMVGCRFLGKHDIGFVAPPKLMRAVKPFMERIGRKWCLRLPATEFTLSVLFLTNTCIFRI